MAVEKQNYDNSQLPESYQVVVVGAGPVGLIASLLLSKYHIPHALVEQLTEPDHHPQAHFLNCRTMEVLRELDAFDQVISAQSAPPEEWRRFVYCTNLADLPAQHQLNPVSTSSLLGMVDHFANASGDEHSPAQVTHFPQHDFVRLLRKRVQKNQFCYLVEGHRADIREYPHHAKVVLTNSQTGQRKEIQTQFLLAADGAHSSIRKQLGIKLTSETGTLQHLINVHFFSPQLAEWLRSSIPAMLYFIYARAGVAVIVAHAFERGEFVAQIPFFPPHQQAESFDKIYCTTLLQKLYGKPIKINVSSIRAWRMGVWQASHFRSESGRCFLIGDAAHQFTPAGGFGMNTGIQDAHNLIWKIATVLKSPINEQSESAEHLLASYERERQPVARLNAKLSVENFEKTLLIPNAIGLNIKAANWLSHWIGCLPCPQALKSAVFKSAMQLGLKQIDWLKSKIFIFRRRHQSVRRIFSNVKQRTLQLLFPGQDLGFSYRKGWFEDRGKYEPVHLDPFEFESKLKLGGRMPHFWLLNKEGRQISVLDLPSLMIGPDYKPCYVMLISAKADIPDEVYDITENKRYQPVVVVEVGSTPNLQSNMHFVFGHARPDFLPPSFAVLMRPDGHIAWFSKETKFNQHPSNMINENMQTKELEMA